MKVKLFQSDGTFIEHQLISVVRYPQAIYWEGGFYLHVGLGHYAVCEYYLIPHSPVIDVDVVSC
jgi:hypothetical protein